MIYYIGNREQLIVKIGYTRDEKSLNERLISLQTGNPYKLEIIDTREGCRYIESQLHLQLKEHNLTGEWFTLNDEVLKSVNNCIPELIIEEFK